MPNNLNLEKHPKVTCLCPTAGRFSALRESISFFLLQDYPNKELLIFNNHSKPLQPHPKLIHQGVKVINAGDYSKKDLPTIYNDAMSHVSDDTEYIAIWDDDDIYFPWHLSESIQTIKESLKKASRVVHSFYGVMENPNFKICNHDKEIEYLSQGNNFEASMVAEKELVCFKKDNNLDPTGTHPHLYWNELVNNLHGGFEPVKQPSCAFRYDNTKWCYPHTQCGVRGSNDTGEGKILKPCAVSKAFYDLIINAKTIWVEGNTYNLISKKEKAAFLERFNDYEIEKFDHIDKYKVWFYWENVHTKDTPEFVKMCHESARLHTYADVVVLNNEILEKYFKADNIYPTSKFYDFSCICYKSDYVRAFILKHYGGFWMDSDVLSVGDLDEYYFKYINYSKSVFPWEYDIPGNLISCCFGCRPESFFITTSLGNIHEFLTTETDEEKLNGWAKLNLVGICKVLQEYYPTFKNQPYQIIGASEGAVDLRYNNGIPADNIPQEVKDYCSKNKWEFTPNDYHENLCLFVFHYSQIGGAFKDKEKNLMTDYEDASKIFDYALNYKSPHYNKVYYNMLQPVITKSKENFTLECNLNDGGWSEIWENCRSQQHPGTYFALYNFLKENNFECIIEIGTGEGGLTEFLCNMLPDTYIISLDLYPRHDGKIGKKYDNLRLLKGDCFASEIIEKLKRETTNKKTCWMLDGGNKNKEFNTFIKIAEKGDFLMMHDFARNAQKHKEIYIEKKRWYWHESGFEDVLNLEQAEWAGEELLEQCLWGTYKKL